MLRAVLRATAALALIVCGCSSSGGAPDAGSAPDAAPPLASPPPSSSSPSAQPEAAAPPLVPLGEPGASASASAAPVYGILPPPEEARRTSLARVAADRILAPHEAVIREHFGGTIPTPLEVQTALLVGDRRAVLLYGPAARRSPLILVLDARGALLWSKERPLAGTQQVVTEMVVAPGPRGEVGLLWCDIPTQVVALRKWGWDGTVLADFTVAEVDVCEALAGLYWPDRGWLVAASQHGAARVQLLDDRGKRAFGPSGVELPWKARPSAPVSMAIDADTSVMLFQVGDLTREGGASPDRILATRLDTLGTPLWMRPLDLGPAPAVAIGAGAVVERIQTTLRSPGQVRVSLGKAPPVLVTSAGSIPAR